MIDPLKTDIIFLAVLFGRNRIEHIIEPADTELEDRSGLRYYLEINVPSFPQSAELERLLKMPGSEKPPILKGGAIIFEGAFFRIDELLNDALERAKPEFKQSLMSLNVSLTMPFELLESIENNGALLPGSSVKRGKQWIIKAGLTEEDFAGWGAVYFDRKLAESRSFLTWQPDFKVINAEQEEYLSFLLNVSPVPAGLVRRVEVTFEDQTTQTLTLGSITGLSAYQVVCSPVGPLALGLDKLSKRVVSYKVWLADSNLARLSEVRTYRIDSRYRRQERFILFANSFGAWDTLRLVGEGAETLKTSRVSAELERPLGVGADFPEIKVVSLQGDRELQISTGWIERNAKQTLRYFDELLLSEEIYLVTDKGHFPLELVTNSLVDDDDTTGLVSRTFLFRRSTPVQNFSNLPAAPLTAARPTGWRGLGLVHTLDANGKRTGRGRPLRLQRYYTDDGSLYKPRTEKPNIQGDRDFIADVTIPGVTPGSTPFPNTALTRDTTFVRTNCSTDQVGGPATIAIAAGKYGGERAGDADEMAENEYKLMNTQDYVNQYGSCVSAPELYTVDIPAGHWHYRAADPKRVGIYWWGGDASTGVTNHNGTIEPNIGNTWDLQGQSRQYVFPVGANDLNFPPKSLDWRFLLYGSPNTTVNAKVYRNGSLVYNQNVLLNPDGGEQISLMFAPAALDKLYFKVTNA